MENVMVHIVVIILMRNICVHHMIYAVQMRIHVPPMEHNVGSAVQIMVRVGTVVKMNNVVLRDNVCQTLRRRDVKHVL